MNNNFKFRVKHLVIILFSLIAFGIYSQSNTDIINRMQALKNEDATFYQFDGVEVTELLINKDFSLKNIIRSNKKYALKEEDFKSVDSLFGLKYFSCFKQSETCPGLSQFTNYYFFQTKENKCLQITFANTQKIESEFEKAILMLILEKKIPEAKFNALTIDSINFAGRRVVLGAICHWVGVNNIQTPYYGQVSWSFHGNLGAAQNKSSDQIMMNKCAKQFNVVSEEEVAVIFEGVEAKAKKIIYGINGITKVLTRLSGGKTLTVYYVAIPVRSTYVSCVMSHWDTDKIGSKGLPVFIGEFMKLKN
jgi:hypothetical protein